MQIFLYLCARIDENIHMKTRFSLFALLVLTCQVLIAQTHIKVKDPNTWTTDELTPYVGQTVIFDVPIIVTSNASSSSYTVSTRRLFTPTNQAIPNSTAIKTVSSMNGKGAMQLSGLSKELRCGDKIYHLTAKVNSPTDLRYISSDPCVNSRAYYDTVNVRRLVNIADCDTCLLVCTSNLENYFIGNNNHDRQRKKVIDALTHIDADLLGFVELECGDAAIKEIVSYLNTNLPHRNYTYVADGTSASGSDTKAAFVYDKKILKTYGELQVIGTGAGKARKAMQVFEQKSNGERFIYSVNHFKAKSGAGTGADADQHDGQGSYNATRCQEAQAVIDLYKRLVPQLDQDNDILIMGDLNAYAKEDPIRKFLDCGMIDLHRAYHADTSYSYQYGGLAGYLDHAICSSSMYKQVRGAIGFHVNSDENDKYTYDKSGDQTMFRYSDHDPVLVGLRLDGSAASYDPHPTTNNLEILRGDANKLIIRDAESTDEKIGYYAIYDMSGRPMVGATKIESNAHVVDLPASGVYILYVYFDGKVYPYKFIVP